SNLFSILLTLKQTKTNPKTESVYRLLKPPKPLKRALNSPLQAVPRSEEVLIIGQNRNLSTTNLK
ncbi:hypothetical protein, partial [Wohlfahrtiimonas larvae]|uniref:hypothetical protein n=1 Tax=Wohlfahrtiimonas larvae TaxID=1157986 RepID=UPI0031EEA098